MEMNDGEEIDDDDDDEKKDLNHSIFPMMTGNISRERIRFD